MKWLKEHEASIVSLVLLLVTAWAGSQHDLPAGFEPAIIAALGAVNVLLHGLGKGTNVVPLEGIQTLLTQVQSAAPTVAPILQTIESDAAQVIAPAQPTNNVTPISAAPSAAPKVEAAG